MAVDDATTHGAATATYGEGVTISGAVATTRVGLTMKDGEAGTMTSD